MGKRNSLALWYGFQVWVVRLFALIFILTFSLGVLGVKYCRAFDPTLVFAGSPAPAEDSDTYMLRYDVDHSSGTDYAYTNSGGGSVQGSIFGGAAASTDQNHTSGGTDSLLVGTTNAKFIVTSGVSGYVNTSEGSLEMWIYIDAADVSGGILSLFEIFPSGSESTHMLRAQIVTDGTIYFRNEQDNSVVSIDTTGTVSTQQWQRLRFRWSVTSNITGVQIGNDSWENDSDSDTVSAAATAPDTMVVGDGNYNSGGNSAILYIDDFETVSGYDTFND